MIGEFVESWPLFHNVYIAGVLIAVLLSLVGVAVVARDQIFLGAAVSQASLLGIATGIWLDGVVAGTALEAISGDLSHSLLGGVFAVAGSLAVSAASARLRESREALTGWLFLAGASSSVLVVSTSPHGMAEVTRLLSSTIIGADAGDVAIFATFLAVTVGAIAVRSTPILLMLTDAETAQASGIPVARWDRALAIWLAIVVAWSIHVAGVVFTFGCLVLPGLLAKGIARELRMLFAIAPAAALLAAMTAFVVANAADLPPGQVTVALLCAAQLPVWALGAKRRS